MLDLRDRLELADGVVVEGSVLRDTALGRRHPANAAGGVVLEGLGETVDSAAVRLSRVFALPIDRARHDALAFGWDLNRTFLVNVRHGSGPFARSLGWARLAVRLAPSGSLPATLAHRRSLTTASWLGAAVSCARALVVRSTALAVVVTLVALHLALVAGSVELSLSVAAGLGAGLGLVVHEAGHAAALRGVPAALVTVGLRTFVLHPPVDGQHRRRVALMGPAAATALGVTLVSMAVEVGAIALAVAACPLAAHAFSLTFLGSDGRNACA